MHKRLLFFRWVKIVLLVYIIIGIAIYFLQDYILFHPEKVDTTHNYNFPIAHRELNIPYDTATNISIIQFLTDSSTAKHGVVLYFHGNRKNIAFYAKYAPNFTKHGYEVWMIDYPGFGKSTGKLTEARLYEYAAQLYKLARTRFSKDNIIIYGKSMGTGIAAWLAAERDCKKLILETPYYSMHDLAAHYFPVYPVSWMVHCRLPTYAYLPKVTVPVIIFHGTKDGVIPYSNAARLKTVLKPADLFVTIAGGSHNNLNDYPLFHQKLDSLLH